MKVRVIKTPSFAGGGLYDGGYQLSPGETQAMVAGYTNAAKNVAGAVKSFGDAANPAAAMIRDTVQGALTGNSSGGSGSLTSALGTASQLSSLAGSAGAAGTAAGATGAAAGAAGAGAAAAGAAGGAAGLAGLASSLAPLAALASDKRVKENIEKVGKAFDGQNIYRFNYKGDPHTQLGLIAQEVEKTGNADSVYNVNGIKMVDYNSATEDAAQKGKFMNGGNYRKRLSSTMSYQEGGTATDPQLLQAYRTIANELANGQDPNALVGQYVDSGMSYDDAQEVVSQVMDFMNPTSEAQMPVAQMGGGNGAIFAGQSTEPSHIIDKPVMKDGGHTFVTSQPAYTKRSHTYFGVSNAPARDNYTDNDQITTSVKAVPREDATIEAEKGEYIFSEQGLYKIEGKKHSKGGTPLAAKGGEFIFSAHRDMSIDPQLQKEAGLKKYSSKALADNTPAKVLERNIDVKEYNRLKAIIDNPKSDVVTKKTAQFMLEKMDSKIQVIAKLQEANKQPDPVEIKDQYIEQPQIQGDINEQKQFAYGGQNLPMYQAAGPTMDPRRAAGIQANNSFGINYATPTTNIPTSIASKPTTQATTPAQQSSEADIFLQSSPETQRLKQLKESGDEVTYSPRIGAGNTQVPLMQAYQTSGLYGDVKTDELGEFRKRHSWYFDKNANWNAANPENVKDFQTKYDQEYAKKYGFSYFPGNRKFNAVDSKFGEYTYNAPGLFEPAKPTEPGKVNGTIPPIELGPEKGPKIKPLDFEVPETADKQGSEKTYTGTEYDNVLKDPYDKIRAMQASQYLSNVVANKPYFTYAAPVNAPLTEAQRMSSQPFMDEAAKARYSANQLASRFGSPVQAMMAAAQQNDAVNKGLFEVGKYNTEAEIQNRNQNLLRSAAATNTWNDRMKQAYDQNTNVLDKMNYANAAYYNQYSTARQKDILDKYYADRDLQTAYIPYLDQYEVQNPDGTWTKRVAAPTYLNGQPNPNWSGFGSSAVNKMAQRQNNNSLKTTIQALKDEGFDQDQIIKILGKQNLGE